MNVQQLLNSPPSFGRLIRPLKVGTRASKKKKNGHKMSKLIFIKNRQKHIK